MATSRIEVEVPRSSTLLNLPVEIFNLILDFVFEDNTANHGLRRCDMTSALILDETYTCKSTLDILLTNKQFYQYNLLALSRTHFQLTNPYSDIPIRLSQLRTTHLSLLRSLTFVADARQFRALRKWGTHPFGLSALNIDNLTLVLHRSSCWHYLYDFTVDLVELLRSLHGVKRLAILRNHARVKGGFKTWYHRLIGLLLKIDHQQRYDVPVPCCEETWWEWRWCEVEQSVEMIALPPKPWVEEEVYFRQILPAMEALRISIESEAIGIESTAVVGDARGWDVI
jgi:hypothetical protein